MGIGGFVGFSAITYTLHFGFIVLLTVAMAVIVGAFAVHEGDGLAETTKRLFLRLVPIGVISGAIALLVWAPFLLAGGLAESGMAQHYLPKNSAFLPLPMTEASVFGALCLIGTVWLIMRCRANDVAAALLTIVTAVYCWYGLSTLALLAHTTLLAFRLEVILTVVLATAGALGSLELVGYLRRKLDLRYAVRITAVACTLGLLGAVSLTQTAIGTVLAEDVEQAYEDYYPSGRNAEGEHSPENPDAWLDELTATIGQLTGRTPQRNVLLTTNYQLLSFVPYWSFQQSTPHYANPLAQYKQRAAEIRKWASADSARELLRMLDRSEFTPPNVFVFRNEPRPQGDGESSDANTPTESPTAESHPAKSGKLTLMLRADAFPQQPNVRTHLVAFDPAVFDSPAFVQRKVGPYTVVALR